MIFLNFLGKLPSGLLWRKPVLISVLIRSLVPFVVLCGNSFPWLAGFFCSLITLFLQAKILISIEIQDFCSPAVSFGEATGTVVMIRKNQHSSTDSEFTFESILIKCCLWGYFGKIICFIVLQRKY